MSTAIVLVFVLGYLGIAFEHRLKVDKAAIALFLGVVLWSMYALTPGLSSHPSAPDPTPPHVMATPDRGADHTGRGHRMATRADEREQALATDRGTSPTPERGTSETLRDAALAADLDHAEAQHSEHQRDVEAHLLKDIAEIASILFFLIGAMTIVELIDAFEGFSIITSRIRATNKVQLLWMVSWLTFFMSAALDNLTTTIVMVSLLKKLVKDRETRMFFVGMTVIAANAGGAWTVIGDVTTTMLWINGKLTPLHTMVMLVVPSIVALKVPLLIASISLKGEIERPDRLESVLAHGVRPFHQKLFLGLGFVLLLFVPVFKTITHLPPFMGMMLGLGIIWMVAESVNHRLDQETRSSTHVVEILKRIDTASILFFLGILLAVGCLGAVGLLDQIANWLDDVVGSRDAVSLAIGLASSIVDNVPLVAAGIRMYDEVPVDDPFWTFLAYCAGTGGSCLIIGSAAGVAAMGLEKIDFFWYFKRISLLALLGYFAGAGVYLLQDWLIGLAGGS